MLRAVAGLAYWLGPNCSVLSLLVMIGVCSALVMCPTIRSGSPRPLG
jgi:hypothetical protein